MSILWSYARPWEKAFLIIWVLLIAQAPFAIGVVDLGDHLGWWSAK